MDGFFDMDQDKTRTRQHQLRGTRRLGRGGPKLKSPRWVMSSRLSLLPRHPGSVPFVFLLSYCLPVTASRKKNSRTLCLLY